MQIKLWYTEIRNAVTTWTIICPGNGLGAGGVVPPKKGRAELLGPDHASFFLPVDEHARDKSHLLQLIKKSSNLK
jgi:hypothetical protein